jgi:integrase
MTNHIPEDMMASFKKVWKKVSTAHARAYDFRSHYAVVNINGWDHCGIEWMDKLLYLSRSMGHRYIQNTLYYYRLVPLFAWPYMGKNTKSEGNGFAGWNNFT